MPNDRNDYTQHADCANCGREGVYVNELGVCKDCVDQRAVADTRYVYSVNCTWHGPIGEVSMTPPAVAQLGALVIGVSIPCCPHCGSPLLEVPSREKWEEGIDKFMQHHQDMPMYRDWLETLRNPCKQLRGWDWRADYEAFAEAKRTGQEPKSAIIAPKRSLRTAGTRMNASQVSVVTAAEMLAVGATPSILGPDRNPVGHSFMLSCIEVEVVAYVTREEFLAMVDAAGIPDLTSADFKAVDMPYFQKIKVKGEPNA